MHWILHDKKVFKQWMVLILTVKEILLWTGQEIHKRKMHWWYVSGEGQERPAIWVRPWRTDGGQIAEKSAGGHSKWRCDISHREVLVAYFDWIWGFMRRVVGDNERNDHGQNRRVLTLVLMINLDFFMSAMGS